LRAASESIEGIREIFHLELERFLEHFFVAVVELFDVVLG